MPTFYEDFSNAITLRAHGSSSYRLQAFGEEAAERLEDAEVVQDLTIVPLQCVGRGRALRAGIHRLGGTRDRHRRHVVAPRVSAHQLVRHQPCEAGG